MSNIINGLKKNRKIIIGVLILVSLPFILPIIEVIIKCLFSLGNAAGSLARGIYESKICL